MPDVDPKGALDVLSEGSLDVLSEGALDVLPKMTVDVEVLSDTVTLISYANAYIL